MCSHDRKAQFNAVNKIKINIIEKKEEENACIGGLLLTIEIKQNSNC